MQVLCSCAVINTIQLLTSGVDVLVCLSMSSWIGLVAQNVVVDMGLNSPVMNPNGVTDERGTKSAITTCVVGVTSDAVIVLKIVEDQETVQR